MMINPITQTNRNLPVSVPGLAERAGNRILRALDRLGVVHRNQDGTRFNVRFSGATVYDNRWLVLAVDAQRLWHFSADDLTKDKVVRTLEVACRWPVRVMREDIYGRRGIYYLVDLAPKRDSGNGTKKVRLPKRVDLDLDTRPEGEVMIPIGRNADGDNWQPLSLVKHALVVGATGSGKSTFAHSVLAGLLPVISPEKLRVAMFDQKRSEFSMWAHVPHLWGNIARSTEESAKLLNDLVEECNNRGDMFASVYARDIESYNKKADEPLPYLLVVVDECIELAMSSDKAIRKGLESLAIRGRSAGVYLLLLTQHATAVAGLPRLAKVNILSRFVFRVTEREAADSAGCKGAHTIPNIEGRMIAKVNGNKPVMHQAFYLDDEKLIEAALGLGRKQEQPKEPPRPTLSELDKQLIAWAILENDGKLTPRDIQEQTELSNRDARRLVEKYRDKDGWLFKDRTARNAHRVTDTARQLVELDLRA
ncbi:MAG: DNA translocase FtsK [Chloroflexi bacterium]|nr:DNA translocase FtsK [Chloroflexota bacterium]